VVLKVDVYLNTIIIKKGELLKCKMSSEYKEATPEEIVRTIVSSGAIAVRDVDSGEEPFTYSTGNRGPGYLMIKGLVGQPSILNFLTKNLAHKLVPFYPGYFEFVEGNATGGMVPAWQLRTDLSEMLRTTIPYSYLRGSRKEGGHGELITGNDNNPLIRKGMKALVVEELVNYAGTTTNAAMEFRAAGYPVSHAACLVSYDHNQSNALLEETGVTLVPLITLPQILNIAEAENLISRNAIDSYNSFLVDPLEWQLSRGLAVPGGILKEDTWEILMVDSNAVRVIPSDSAKKARDLGYNMRLLSPHEAVKKGVPKGKAIGERISYWERVE